MTNDIFQTENMHIYKNVYPTSNISFFCFMCFSNSPIFSLPQAFLRKTSIPLVSLFTLLRNCFTCYKRHLTVLLFILYFFLVLYLDELYLCFSSFCIVTKVKISNGHCPPPHFIFILPLRIFRSLNCIYVDCA